MITKINGEQPFQVLTNNFSISPSETGYQLQISANGSDYTTLFSVGANTTRLVTGVAANSYYRLLGNSGDVVINWQKVCVTEGGGGDLSNYYTKSETDAAIEEAISGITVDLSDYYTSAQTETAIAEATEDFITSAETAQQIEAYNYTTSAETEQQIAEATEELIGGDLIGSEGSVQDALENAGIFVDGVGMRSVPDMIGDVTDLFSGITSGLTAELSEVERVTSTAINSLRTDVNTISGATANMVTSAYGSGHNVTDIWQGTQDDYNMLTQSGATANPTTFYIIKNNPTEEL